MTSLRMLSDTDIQHIELALSHYAQRIWESPGAQDYIVNKRHINKKTIEAFGIGFSDRTLHEAITEEIRGACQRFGIFSTHRVSIGREVFRGCITFPVRDEYGYLVNIYGRKICDTLRKSSDVYVIANAHNKSVFNAQVLANYRRVVLCSSPIEAVTAWSMGIENVVSLLGMQTLSDEQVLQLQFNNIEEVDLLFSGSPKAARCLGVTQKKLRNAGINSTKVWLPKGQDINDCYTNRCDFLVAMKNLAKNSQQNLKLRS